MKVQVEKKGTNKPKDFGLASIFSVVLAVIQGAAQMLEAQGDFNIDWYSLVGTAIGAFLLTLGYTRYREDRIVVKPEVPGENVEAKAQEVQRIVR